jgi:hypothetical protein
MNKEIANDKTKPPNLQDETPPPLRDRPGHRSVHFSRLSNRCACRRSRARPVLLLFLFLPFNQFVPISCSGFRSPGGSQCGNQRGCRCEPVISTPAKVYTVHGRAARRPCPCSRQVGSISVATVGLHFKVLRNEWTEEGRRSSSGHLQARKKRGLYVFPHPPIDRIELIRVFTSSAGRLRAPGAGPWRFSTSPAPCRFHRADFWPSTGGRTRLPDWRVWRGSKRCPPSLRNEGFGKARWKKGRRVARGVRS